MIKIEVDAPKSMKDFARTPQARTKPYDICLYCPFMCTTCDGPNILAMEYPRWVEWAKERIRQLGLTRVEMAERSGVPQSTIASALSGSNYDIRSDTMRKITKVLIGGCWGQYPCHLASLLMDGIEDEEDSTDSRLAELAAAASKAEERIQEVKAESQAKIEYLKGQVLLRDKHLEQKNRMISLLVGAIVVLAALTTLAVMI